MSSCIFCNIVTGDSPAQICYQDDKIIVFKDIKPASKFHLLSVPIEHIPNINYLTKSHLLLVETLIETGKKAIEEQGGNLDDILMGFHCPPFNSVGHVHLHLISPASEMSFKSRLVFRPNSYWFTTAEEFLKRLKNKL